MSKNAVAGIQAAGRQPIWIIQIADAPADITDDTETLPLATLATAQKLDCYMNFGGFELTREQTTTTRQRMCQKVAEEIKTGETITGSATIVWDQQKINASPEDVINQAYLALPEGQEVILFVAHGWDQDQDPDATTVGDIWRVRVSQMDHLFAANADEDIMARASLSGSLFVPNVSLAA